MGRLGAFPEDMLRAHALGGPQPVCIQSMPTDPERRLRAIGNAIVEVVTDSYVKHHMRNRTAAEDLRRAEVCTRWFNRLVNHYRWTADQALSAMRVVLDDELSGRTPALCSKQTMYAPDLTLVH